MKPRTGSAHLPLVAALLAALAAAGCQSLDGCFCCNNCVTNYFLDMPKGQSAEALFRQEDFEGCIEKSEQVRTPTAYQKVVYAKCLEAAGRLEQAAALYREILAGDPQGNYSPARESQEHLAKLGKARPRDASAAWPSLAEPARPVGGGEHDAALVVGIGEPFALPPIAGAAENATDWYRWLTAGLGVPAERVTLLRNAEATRESMLEAALRVGRAARGGRAWFVFVGHGAPAAGGEDGLLLGADAQPTEASLSARGLAQGELYRALQGGGATSVVAVVDACFSGLAPDGKTPLVPGSQATVPVRRSPGGARLVVLSSSEQVAGPLPRGERPAFSYLLLGALRGWADADHDGRVTALEAHRYAEGALRAVVTDRDQRPRLEPPSSALVLAGSAGEGGPDLAAIVAGAPAGY